MAKPPGKPTKKNTARPRQTRQRPAPKRPPRPAGPSADTRWHPAFLEKLKDHGIVQLALSQCKVPSRTAYNHRERDEAFAQAWEEAVELSTARMEEEAVKRAMEGQEIPVYDKGEQVGSYQKKSDTMLIFLLKSRKPSQYRERYEHTGADGGPISLKLHMEEVQELEASIAEAVGSGGEPETKGPIGFVSQAKRGKR